MAQLLFANNTTTTISGAITATALAVAVSAGSGVEFPSPIAGQYFVATFNDAATGLLTEIVWVTAVSGDTLTIVRAREGTTALAWNAGDILSNLWTAGSAGQMLQIGVDAPDNFAIASLTSSTTNNITTNAYTLTWNLTQTTYAQGNPQGLVYFTNANTSATCTLNDGTGAKTLLRADGLYPVAGDASGYCFVFYDGNAWRFSDLLTISDVLAIISAGAIGHSSKPFTSSSTWVVPAGIYNVRADAWGGGGGGGGMGNAAAGGGGGGGASGYGWGWYAVAPGSTLNITVGAPGSGGAAGGNNGTGGGTTTVTGFSGGLSLSCSGGAGGTGFTSGTGGGGGGGTPTGAADGSVGGSGQNGIQVGSAYLGGQGGGVTGGGSPSFNAAGVGAAGNFPGGGAGGGAQNYPGGPGAGGKVLLTW